MKAVAAAILVILAVAAAEVAVIKKCEKVSQDACTISELRISPCPRSPCPFKKGRNASMEFDYVPNFSADKMKTAVYWADDPTEAPFASVGIMDACQFTACPVASGTSQKLTYQMYIGKKLPKGKFMFRWKLWNSADSAQVCCFETQVELK